jgi:hypothetical protein
LSPINGVLEKEVFLEEKVEKSYEAVESYKN